MTDWVEITRRNARSVQTTIGWIFWDPGAVERYERLGLPGPLGYIASRAAPLGPAGSRRDDRRLRLDQPDRDPARVRPRRAAHDVRRGLGARDEAVVVGLPRARADIVEPLAASGSGVVADRRPAADRRPRVLRRASRHAAPRRSVVVGMARGELPPRVARRSALGAGHRGRARRRRGIDRAQRVARVRARLARHVARYRARRHRTWRGARSSSARASCATAR